MFWIVCNYRLNACPDYSCPNSSIYLVEMLLKVHDVAVHYAQKKDSISLKRHKIGHNFDICVMIVFLCLSGSHSVNLNLRPNGCRAWAWKTLFQLPTPVSAQNTSGPNASGITTANSFWERMLYPLYCRTKQQRWAFRLYTHNRVLQLSNPIILSYTVNN